MVHHRLALVVVGFGQRPRQLRNGEREVRNEEPREVTELGEVGELGEVKERRKVNELVFVDIIVDGEDELRQLLVHLEQARVGPLTRLANRRAFEEALERRPALYAAKRDGRTALTSPAPALCR